jgi:HSP20 family protein
MTLGNVGKDFLPLHWLSEGWAALRDQAHNALTHFKSDEEATADPSSPAVQRWGLIAADIIDHDDRLEVRMEVPGMAKEDLKVEVSGGQLSVTGEKRVDASRKEGDLVITERAFGQFRRVFPLPSAVQADAAHASYTDGILAIDLPKVSPSNSNQVTVK